MRILKIIKSIPQGTRLGPPFSCRNCVSGSEVSSRHPGNQAGRLHTLATPTGNEESGDERQLGVEKRGGQEGKLSERTEERE
jgi:hypothetical protein